MSQIVQFGLNPDLFEKAFPFHFIFNPALKVLHVGQSLKKILGENLQDKYVNDLFKFIQPKIPFQKENLIDNLDHEFLFKSVDKNIQLRGELVYDQQLQIFIFLGGPWLTELSQLEELGLNLKDFAINDPSLRYFNVIDQYQEALLDARGLADKLVLQGKELKQKEEQLSMALEGGQDGIWDWRLDNDDFYYSPRLVEMLGYQYGEIRPKFNAIEKLIRDEDLIKLEGVLANHFRYGEPFEVECRYRTKKGEWKWILSRGKVVEWKGDGSPLRMVGLNSDINERKRAEEELKGLHNRLIDAIEILDSGFAIFDKNERLVVCNSRYRSMYSEAAKVMIPGTPYDFILDTLCKKGVPQKSGIDPQKWVAHRIGCHRNPCGFREERLKNIWVRIDERRTSEGGVVSLLTDITDRVMAEDTLRRYVDIVQSTNEGIISFDLQGVIQSWNPACYEIFGFTPQEAVGQHMSMIFPDHLMHEMTEILESLRHGIRQDRHETVRIKKDGNLVYISQTISPIVDKKERVVGASYVVQDISEKKRIEEEIRKRDILLQGINQASHYLITEENFFIALGLAIDCVAESLKMDAISAQFSDSKEVMDGHRYIWKKGIKKTKELLQIPSKWSAELKEGGFLLIHEPFNEEKNLLVIQDTKTLLVLPIIIEGYLSGIITFEDAKGKREWQENEIFLLSSFSYTIGGSFAKEIAEEQLKASELKFRKVFDTSKDGIIAVNQKGLITLFNPAAEKMFKMNHHNAISQPLDLFFPSEYLEDGKKFLFPKRSGNRLIREIYGQKSDGSLFPVEISISQEEAKEENFIVGIIRDISERKQAEMQLALAREKEIDIGFRIQHALLLGKPPDNIRGMEISLVTIASQGIDGDFYDFFPHTSSEFDMLIGDVMGKGIPAALLGAATKSAFNHAITNLTITSKGKIPEPKDILDTVHQLITPQMIELESFMTIWYARFNNNLKQMTFVDCGHTHTLHYRKNEKNVFALKGKNTPLGFLPEEKYEQETIKYGYGDIFLFYSDGITEARGKNDEFFGMDRLKEILVKKSEYSVNDIIKEVTTAVENFSKTAVFEDDLTCIAVKIEDIRQRLEFLESSQILKSLDQLDTLRKLIVNFCERASHGLSPLKIIELELAANEVFTNIVRHSSFPDSDKIGLVLEMYSDRIRVNFDYMGKKFEPPAIELPSYDKTVPGGFGLYIIQMMVDEVVYQEIEINKQRIILVKYLN